MRDLVARFRRHFDTVQSDKTDMFWKPSETLYKDRVIGKFFRVRMTSHKARQQKPNRNG